MSEFAMNPYPEGGQRRTIMNNYTNTADQLVDRIKALIPEHPEILSLDDAWKLFQVPGFRCDDIGPSFAQAMWALAKAKQDYRGNHE